MSESPNLHVFRLWEEIGAMREKPFRWSTAVSWTHTEAKNTLMSILLLPVGYYRQDKCLTVQYRTAFEETGRKKQLLLRDGFEETWSRYLCGELVLQLFQSRQAVMLVSLLFFGGFHLWLRWFCLTHRVLRELNTLCNFVYFKPKSFSSYFPFEVHLGSFTI